MAHDHRRWREAAALVLAVLWLAQSVVMVRQGNWGWGPLARSWYRPLTWRSARFARGPAFAAKIAALRAAIPPEARVVLPGDDVAPLGKGVRERDLEWFLFPRRVTNCVGAACLHDWIAGAQAFVLWTPSAFSLAQAPPGRVHLLDEDLALVAPSPALARYWAPDPSLSASRWLVEGLAELALLALMAWGGWGLLKLLGRPQGGDVLTGVVAWALGSGAFTFGVYLLLLGGASLRRAVWMVAPLWAGLGLAGWRRRHSQGAVSPTWIPRRAWTGFALLVAWAVLLAVLAVGKGYHESDALSIWGIKGYGIAQWGLRQGTYLGLVRDYPLHVPLLVALPKALWGDLTGMSKLVFPVFFLGILTVLYWEIYRSTRAVSGAFLAAAFWATAPLVVHHAEIAYANLALAFYLFLGLWLWLEREEWLPAGLVLAWGIWARPEGWMLVGAVLFLGGRLASSRKNIGKIAWPPLVVFLFWLSTRRLAYAYRFAPGVLKTFLPGVLAFLQGEVHPEGVRAVACAWLRFFWGRLWGVMGGLALLGGAVLLVLGLWQPLSGRRALRSSWAMAAAGLGTVVVVSGIYYFTAYLPDYDIHWWINTGFDRMNLPAMTLLWYAVWRGFGDLWRGRSRGGSESAKPLAEVL